MRVDISQLKAIAQNYDKLTESMVYVATRCYWEHSTLQNLGARREYCIKGYGAFVL